MKKDKDNSLGMKLEAELDDLMGVDIEQMKSSGKGSSGKKKKKGKKKIIILAGLGVVVVALGVMGGAYVVQAQKYKTQFFPGTYINSIDCSNLTEEEVENLIRRQVESYSMTLAFRGDETETVDGQEFDYKYVNDSGVADLLASQQILQWYTESKKTHEYTLESNTSYDGGKLTAIVESMDALLPENQTAPADARIEYQEDSFVIVPEDVGSTLDEAVLLSAIEEAIITGQTEINVEETGAYASPAVTSEDEKLNTQLQQLNTYAGASITYTLPQGDKVLNGETLMTWLDQDAEGNYSRNDETFAQNIQDFVTALAEETDTLGDETSFTATDGSVVNVKCIDYGWEVDQEKELETLTREIDENTVITREPEYTSKMSTTENGGFGNTYIEANLTEQHVYFYKDGALVFESDCVSGKMTTDRYTPPGVYLLDYKQKDRTLRGRQYSDGSYSYESHVDYWMPFYGGYGFHDASWRYGNFGGSIYKSNGSHGCVNLPPSKAAELYDLITDEIPIVIFYTHEYTLGAAEPFVDRTVKKDNDDKDTDDSPDDKKPDNSGSTGGGDTGSTGGGDSGTTGGGDTGSTGGGDNGSTGGGDTGSTGGGDSGTTGGGDTGSTGGGDSGTTGGGDSGSGGSEGSGGSGEEGGSTEE